MNSSKRRMEKRRKIPSSFALLGLCRSLGARRRVEDLRFKMASASPQLTQIVQGEREGTIAGVLVQPKAGRVAVRSAELRTNSDFCG